MTLVFNDLNFEISGFPAWRREKTKTSSTNDMLGRVSTSLTNVDVGDRERERMRQEFVRITCIGEDVGPKTKDDVMHLFVDSSPTAREQVEAQNIYRALLETETIRREMDRTGFLTYQQVLRLHEILMEGVHHGNGTLRVNPAYTTRDTGIFYYPSPDCLEQRLYTIIDQHNDHMVEWDRWGRPFDLLVKCAAWLLFNFVDLHPFPDGNGRTCRLLANYVLGLSVPFPVAICNEQASRDAYLAAIIQCSLCPENGLGDLAAMLVEGLWVGWRTLFNEFSVLIKYS